MSLLTAFLKRTFEIVIVLDPLCFLFALGCYFVVFHVDGGRKGNMLSQMQRGRGWEGEETYEYTKGREECKLLIVPLLGSL